MYLVCRKCRRDIDNHLRACKFVDFYYECIITIQNGHLECLKKVRINGDRLCSIAAAYGKLNILKYAHENEYPWNESVFSAAAENGHLDCLKYLHANRCPWSESTCSTAARNGHLDCIKYLHENRCPWDEGTCYQAAGNGHLDCLKYAHENKCWWGKETRYIAAERGHLECLKFTYENIPKYRNYAYIDPYREELCNELKYNKCVSNCAIYDAARRGYLHILKYIHANGQSWGDDACKGAIEGNKLDCLKYIHKTGGLLDSSLYKSAVKYGGHEIIEYLHLNGCPWDDELWAIYRRIGSCERVNIETVKYIHKIGLSCSNNCNSTTWCERRCDVCWRYICDEHDSAKTFKQLANKETFLYEDIINVICSFI